MHFTVHQVPLSLSLFCQVAPTVMQNRSVAGCSFPLQIFLVLSLLFTPFWFVLTIALLSFKVANLPFPSNAAIALEFIGALLLWLVQWRSAEQAKAGNLTEQSGPLGIGVLGLLFSTAGAVYYMRGQTYVMRLDLGFSATLVAINGLCILLSLAALNSISQSARPQQNITKGGPIPTTPSNSSPPSQHPSQSSIQRGSVQGSGNQGMPPPGQQVRTE